VYKIFRNYQVEGRKRPGLERLTFPAKSWRNALCLSRPRHPVTSGVGPPVCAIATAGVIETNITAANNA